MTDKYVVTAEWDDEGEVWVATSDDIPGLVTEAKSLEGLLQRVSAVAPELLEDNAHLLPGGVAPQGKIDLHIVSQLNIGSVAQ